MNYKRKSTDGYNVLNVFLDLSGGVLSIFQMVLNACNYSKKTYRGREMMKKSTFLVNRFLVEFLEKPHEIWNRPADIGIRRNHADSALLALQQSGSYES